MRTLRSQLQALIRLCLSWRIRLQRQTTNVGLMYSTTNTTTAFGCHNINVNFTKHKSNVFQMVGRTHFISHDDSYLMQLDRGGRRQRSRMVSVPGGADTIPRRLEPLPSLYTYVWTSCALRCSLYNYIPKCTVLTIYNLRKISPGIQKLRSKWGHVRGRAEVRPCLCRKMTLLISRTMQNTPRHCVKNTAFIAKPGGTQVVESTTLETVTRHFRAKGMTKHQPKSTHLTAFGVIKFFDRQTSHNTTK
jgi:hypothetical protein